MSGARDNEIPLWTPREDCIARTAMYKFMRRAADEYGVAANYDALYQWSIAEREKFWALVWDFTGIRASRRGHTVLENRDAMPGAKWFRGARLNFAENLLRHRDDRPAIIACDEHGRQTTLSHRELYAEVARVTAQLRDLGIQPGDRIAGYMANTPETIIAMLATSAIGAIWSSCSPDFGARGVLERFAQIQPRILFAVDGYHYNGKEFDVRAAVAEIANALDSVEAVICAPFLYRGDRRELSATRARVLWFDEFKTAADEIEFAQLPFAQPLYILYSSGTTGPPKCIVHSAGGTLLQHRKEHMLHTDLSRTDRFFYLTTCGWMMWNWLVSGLSGGCALVLYDGAPLYPRPEKLFALADRLGVTIFGAGAPYFAALAKAKLQPRDDFELKNLRAILSTGAPLSAENFDYAYRDIKSDAMLASISGGTDIISCFVLGNPLRPVYRGEIQGAGLGMDVAVYADGKFVRGARGELVCRKPFPSMPLGFWNDAGDRKFKQAYFSRVKNCWAQGDWAEITARDGMIIHGRSDAVLNPGGVRIGTAEIYRQVEKVDEVLESLCIAQNWQGDSRVVLFVVLRDNLRLTDELTSRIAATIQRHTTRRHRPKKIIAVKELPRTRSGKITELAVRNIIRNEPVANTAALANPDALEYFRDLPELQED